MSIRLRLRSSSSSHEKYSPERVDIDENEEEEEVEEEEVKEEVEEFQNQCGECELCGQRSNSGSTLLLTCSVCATQYHPKCLDLRSDLFKDANSKVYNSWVCKQCIRCLFCRKKKVKISKNYALVSSLRSRLNRNTESSEMIACKECDASIHTYCFFKLLQRSQNDTSDISIREIRRKKNNFVCNSCSGTEETMEDDLEDESEGVEFDDTCNSDNYEDDEDEDGDDGDDNNNFPASEASSEDEVADEEIDEDCQRQIKMRNRLKQLGITNVEEHLNRTDLNEKRILRNNRLVKSSTSADESQTIESDTNLEVKQEETEESIPKETNKTTRKRRTFQVIKPRKRRRNEADVSTRLFNLSAESPVSSLLMASKLFKNKSTTDNESDDDSRQQTSNRRWKTSEKRNKSRARANLNENPEFKSNKNYNRCQNLHSDSENDDNHLTENCCTVSGCDSKGHLSGMFDTHSIVDTCPLFHNQTAEECVQRYNKRLKYKEKYCNNNNNSSTTLTTREQNDTHKSKKSSQLSPNKKTNNPKWDLVMDYRRIETLGKNGNSNSDPIMTMTSSRQPKLDGFTPSFDLDIFREAQSRTAELIHLNSALELYDPNNDQKLELDEYESSSPTRSNVRSIVLGKHEIGVWYASPYSDEFLNCLKLYICEFCLKCMNVSIILQRHTNKCSLKHPPGNEIYRKGNTSFFEIDGDVQKEYCQNLCLLAKLFLDHKTLFFDVEPFLFYVMTEYDSDGMHIVGYFSKEKHSPNSYNVSCILTLPPYQRLGYGRMLIEFSYLLTKVENKVGSPEKPLSDLGLISYRSYWKFIIMDYLSTYEGKDLLLKDMSQQTGINSNDIVSTLQLMGLLKYWKGKHLILVPKELRSKFLNEVKKKKKIYSSKMIDPKCLSWTPKNYR